jgi:hypothetical protein
MKKKPHNPGNRPVMRGGKVVTRAGGHALKGEHAFASRQPVNRRERRAAAKLARLQDRP